jgi:RHS repeat-associated protein
MKALHKILFITMAAMLLATQAKAVLYWGRPYDPNLQRWIQRDPIAEQGGINLHQFVGNNPVNGIDPIGLWTLGFGFQGNFSIFLAGVENIGLYVGHNPDQSWHSGWSVGVLNTGGLGAGALAMGAGAFVQKTSAKCVSNLKGFGIDLGASVGPRPFEPIAVGGDFLAGFENAGHGYATIPYTGWQGNLQISDGAPLEIHGLATWTSGWDSDNGFR